MRNYLPQLFLSFVLLSFRFQHAHAKFSASASASTSTSTSTSEELDEEDQPPSQFIAGLERQVGDAEQDTLYIHDPSFTPPLSGNETQSIDVSVSVLPEASSAIDAEEASKPPEGPLAEGPSWEKNHHDSEEGGWRQGSASSTPLLGIGSTIFLLASGIAQPKPKRRRLNAPDDDGDPVEARQTKDTALAQPETRLISHEQLVAEIKGIYGGLVMVESKCIEIDNAQLLQSDVMLNNEQWQALIALHRTLLHEHHDFFLASQYPSARPAVRRLASKYAMPARLWRHGIYSFLELLRRRLPASLDHMRTFVELAYSMIFLLYETVPAFGDTWIECLGNIDRYVMAIEEDDTKNREVWTTMSRYWYMKASLNAPTIGRLYHHLAIVARPNTLQQLFYYTKSLCVHVPFESARESILTLFDPILDSHLGQRSLLVDELFVLAHSALFKHADSTETEKAQEKFLTMLDEHLATQCEKWIEAGSYTAIVTANSILSYGDGDNPVMRIMAQASPTADSKVNNDTNTTCGIMDLEYLTMLSTCCDLETSKQISFLQALALATRIDECVLKRFDHCGILPYVHARLIFLHHITKYQAITDSVLAIFPWEALAALLNRLEATTTIRIIDANDDMSTFLVDSTKNMWLPEDNQLIGLIWTAGDFPDDWAFRSEEMADVSDPKNAIAHDAIRRERIIWLGHIFAKQSKYLWYDDQERRFVASNDASELSDDTTTSHPVQVQQEQRNSNGMTIENMAVLDIDHHTLHRLPTIRMSEAPHIDEKAGPGDHDPAQSASPGPSKHTPPATSVGKGTPKRKSRLPRPKKDVSTPSPSSSSPRPLAAKRPDQFPCPWEGCKKNFQQESYLKKHELSHTKPAVCDAAKCVYRCASFRDLKRHRQVHHPEAYAKEEFPCELCDCSPFGRKDNLKRHMDAKHGKK